MKGAECFIIVKRKVKPKIVERKLGRERALGQATHGEDLVEVDPRHPSELARLDTVIHEMLHLCLPDVCESRIKTYTAFIVRGLWQQKYRRVRL